MRVLLLLMAIVMVAYTPTQAQFFKHLKHTIKHKVVHRADSLTGSAKDKSLDKLEGKDKNTAQQPNDTPGINTTTGNGKPGDQQQGILSYQNYDFVPGDTILFEDNFVDDQDGEFPSHWDLNSGQAVVNKVNDKPAFFLTQGNYCKVYPRMKTSSYLTDPFTIEFDYYPSSGASGPIVFLKYKNKAGDDQEGEVQFGNSGEVSTGYFSKDFNNTYPNENDDTYLNQWHHCAIIYKNNELKCYIDQYRILVVPSLDAIPISFGLGGIGNQTHPMIIANVRTAAGGNMNMIGKKFTQSKIVTHGITFDIDKADIKPESMGTLNMIAGVLKSNPDLKFEIDGHTDNTGEAAHNLTLSQQRADAVKAQLVQMGISASRLTTKGFGDTKPIDTNDTPEGKANNRRVEFVKM
ncbi:MAG TPA: OmpA family protein [Balneolales bacterium]|nr:OmpA family protein [Balneolales bacterium]